MSWSGLSDWWIEELESDEAYEEVVTPLLLDVLGPIGGARYLDLGSGEGRVLRSLGALGAKPVGLELNEDLASRSSSPTAVADIAAIPFRDEAFDGVYAVLVLEHIADHGGFFSRCAGLVRAGGVLAIVANHPIWTAPDSTPITDADGEVLWRPGAYFSDGASEFPAGDGSVTFHHRTIAGLLGGAAAAGWCLERIIERPHHEFEDQSGIPRLLACRWVKRS